MFQIKSLSFADLVSEQKKICDIFREADSSGPLIWQYREYGMEKERNSYIFQISTFHIFQYFCEKHTPEQVFEKHEAVREPT